MSKIETSLPGCINSQEAFKIVEISPHGVLRTLFNGVNRSRTLEPGTWLEAQVTWNRDGSGDKWYWTGWHSLPEFEGAVKYLQHFRVNTGRLGIVSCEISEVWEKPRTRQPVYLSRWLKISELVHPSSLSRQD